MLDRFIWFKDEIELLLEKARQLSTSKRNDLKLDTLEITNIEQDYIIKVRDILEVFRVPTKKFQARDYETISWTIPRVVGLIRDLKDFLEDSYNITNPYILFGLNQAIIKIYDYYPFNDLTTLGPNKKTIVFNKLRYLFITTILNPRFKTKTLRNNPIRIGPKIEEECINYLKELYTIYKDEYNTNKSTNSKQNRVGDNTIASTSRNN